MRKSGSYVAKSFELNEPVATATHEYPAERDACISKGVSPTTNTSLTPSRERVSETYLPS